MESVKYFAGVEKYYIVLNLLKTTHFVRFSISRTFSISNKSPGPLKVRDRESLMYDNRKYPADTNVWRLRKITTSYDQTRRSHDIWKKTSDLRRLKDVWFTSSWRRPIYDVLKTSDLLCLEDVQFTTSWRRLIYDVFRTSSLQCPEDVWFTWSWRRPICDTLKTSDLLRFQDVWFTTSWRRPIYDDVLKMSVKRHLCSNVVATSTQRRKKWLFLILYCLKYSENFKCSSLS